MVRKDVSACVSMKLEENVIQRQEQCQMPQKGQVGGNGIAKALLAKSKEHGVLMSG